MTTLQARPTPLPDHADDALRGVFDGPRAAVRARAREQFGQRELRADPTLDLDGRRDRITGLMHEIADSGASRLGFASAHGGGGDLGASVNWLQVIGHVDLSLLVKAGVQWGLFGGAIQELGTAAHHERHLPAIMDLDLPGCFAMTETGHGSDVQRLSTTATYDPTREEFVVDTPDDAARKDYIGNAARDGRLAVVFAQLITGGTRRGVHALVVPIRHADGQPCAGVTISDCGAKAGLNGVDNGRLSFDSVRVPRDALLDRYGSVAPDGTYTSPIDDPDRRFFTMLGTLVRGRIVVAAGAGAATQSALAIATRYALNRRQFTAGDGADEVLLLDYLAHQRRLLPKLATTYALQFALHEVVERAEHVRRAATVGPSDSGDQRAVELLAAGLKAVTTWHATDTIQTCREACGGAGYLADSRLPQLKADTDVFTTFEGDNTVLLQLVTKGLLGGYRDRYAALDAVGSARFAAGIAADALAEKSGARALLQRWGRADVRDRGWHLALFADRAEHVLSGLARRLLRAGSAEDAFAVYNATQDHVLRAARVHVERVVLESFVAAIERCSDAATASLLERLCDLYALSVIEADRAWLLEHGRLSTGRAKAVTREVNRLCGELRPDAGRLIDGFGIPEPWLRAPALVDARGPEQLRPAS